jgi:hypothetical protein
VLLGAAFTGFYVLVKGELSQLSTLIAGGVLLVVSVAVSLFAEMKSKAVTE